MLQRRKTAILVSFLLFFSILSPAHPASRLMGLVSPNGTFTVRDGDKILATVAPIVYFEDWSSRDFSGAKPLEGRLGGTLEFAAGAVGTLEASVSQVGDSLKVTYTVSTSASVRVQTVCASLHITASQWVGAPFSLDAKQGTIGMALKDTWLSEGNARMLQVGPAPNLSGLSMTLARDAQGPVLFQDSRRWCDCLEVRMAGRPWGPSTWEASEPQVLSFTLSFNKPLQVVRDEAVELSAGGDWIPLSGGLDIVPGSALDFSDQYGERAPAGTFGWVQVDTQDPSHFSFQGKPGHALRFYGANLCFSALFLDHALAERLAERLMRLGYNSVRIHHYESMPWDETGGIIDPKAEDSLTFLPANLDKLDYLFAELKKRGLYMTTDLYVNRAVKASELFPGAQGDVAYAFKHLVPVSKRAMDNWKEFSRRLLTHVNPYTHLAYKDDPALAWISLINEDDLGNYLSEMRKDPRESVLWEKAYGKWRDAHGAKGEAWDSPDFHHFLWEVQDKAEAEQITFLRKLGVKALLTDLNAWTEEAGTQACRSRFDYVDDHFYWDHPHFLEKDWSLPSRGGSGGGSSIPGGGEVSGRALTRLQGKPYTITEFNYASPNPFRAEGGLLTGAFAALQDWGGLWRFDYSGARDGIATPQPMEYFDVVRDPLRQASDYAAMALFSRGDATSAPHGIALTGTLQDYWNQAPEALSAGFPLLAWCVKLATKVGGAADPAWLEIPFSQRNTETDKALEKLRAKGGPLQLGGTDLSQGIFESETGEARLETKSGVFSVNTQRTAGLAGPEGTERTLGPLTLSLTKSWGTVFAVSLDRLPLAESRRILVAHLTDLKNTGMVFRGMDMQVLEKVGSLPYLVKAGSAEVKMKKSGVKGARVYRLDTTGKRVAEAPSRFKGGVLEFTASTATQPDATFYYEIVAEP